MALLLALAPLSQSVWGAEAAKAPQVVVEDVTSKMMGVIKTSEKVLKDNPEAYYGEIRGVLEPIVSFDFIARNVMANYWKSASAEQRQRFTETFTRSMVETLGKGLANYSDLEIRTIAPTEDLASASKVEIVQEVKGTEGVNRLSYTMAKHRSGEWKLINVVLNGVNLGKSFRDQFAQAMRQNDNNVDRVIENWAATS